MQSRLTFFQEPQSVYETTLPWLHPNIAIEHLHTNAKLLTEAQISEAAIWFAANPDKNRMKKSESKSYSLLKLKNPASQQECLFAIYFGEKQNKSLGKGTYSKVKLMQELKSGKWYALKLLQKIPSLTTGKCS